MTACEAAPKVALRNGWREVRETVLVPKVPLALATTLRGTGLTAWVRSSMIEAGAKEQGLAQLVKLKDLDGPVVET